MADFAISKEEAETRGRYFTVVDGMEGELTFSKMGETAVIADHTGVPETLAGRGIGKALVEAMIEDARNMGFKIMPLCPFVRRQYAHHPEWKDTMM
ncbi:N-acetyltransferase [Phaeobacter gallaeciensis]|uniref:N-acetyltransferase n=2 Tax=Roseobacteraceae TaxID=2854170 RepID=A0A366WN58_9RHOB|nr:MULTISPECIES: GNAT family N-acetyltransferase [Roseobacteraceae]MBT3143104.1 N-acetyltransferase [Falsiruegeria litorea]MBT8166796.1 N-acetyltransferase [Falsiruegeria litorea]RBW51638.1 N-acetyltransferase [Phaeobacter gallaeciensis]